MLPRCSIRRSRSASRPSSAAGDDRPWLGVYLDNGADGGAVVNSLIGDGPARAAGLE